jgi:DNA-binding NtrC family response regulator
MKKITLYIIDDEEEVVTALRAVFKPNKRYRVRAHSSVAAALQDVEEIPPQLVICDQLMPECDGITALRELKRRYPRLRSVLLTGQALDEEMLEGMKEGVVDLYVAKPWNQAELEETVARLAREVAKAG